MFVAQQVNELMESDAVYGADPVADLVFNSLGLYLFTRDDFASIFASDTLHLHYWPGQPFVDVEDTVLFNNDETYLWRISMGGWTSWKLGVLTGTKINGFGFSVPNKRNEYWSIFFVSLGVQGFPQKPYEPPEVERIRPIKELEEETKASKDDQTEEEEIEPDQVAVRLTWDEKGSLMTYTDIGYFPKFMLTTNIYPGIWRLGDTGVGLFAHYGAEGTHSLGITLSTLSVLPGYRF